MSKVRCRRGCGATWNKGDKTAELAHGIVCPKAWFGNGARFAGKQHPIFTPKKGKR